MKRRGKAIAETELYRPVKALFEAQGYTVKGEIARCDVVAIRGEEPPVVVELKRGMTIGLLEQAADRLAVTDRVYVAIGTPSTASSRRLCRMLGIGLIEVHVQGRAGEIAEAILDPGPYRARGSGRRRAEVTREFQKRRGDPTPGGAVGRAIMTAYRQQALRCAVMLAVYGPAGPAALRHAGMPDAAKILQRNVYGWFTRLARGLYGLDADGHAALGRFAPALAPEDQALLRGTGDAKPEQPQSTAIPSARSHDHSRAA